LGTVEEYGAVADGHEMDAQAVGYGAPNAARYEERKEQRAGAQADEIPHAASAEGRLDREKEQ